MLRALAIGFLSALATAMAGCTGERTVQFGAVLPLTGEAQIYGQPIQRGIELAFDEIVGDDEGEDAITLSVLDSASDSEKAAALTAQLYEDGALAVIGGVTTAEALAMVPVADRAERVLLSPSASSPELTGISKYFYRVFISDAKEGATMATFATQKRKVGSVVILAKSDNPYAMGNQQVFQSEFERQGGQVLDLIEFPSGSDLEGLVERVLTLDPEAVYLAAYATDTAALIRQVDAEGYKGDIYTTSAFSTPDIIAEAGQAADEVFLTQAVFQADSEDPEIQSFVGRFRERFNSAPDLYAAHGYDAMKTLAAALERGQRGGAPSEFWASIRSLRDFSGVTGSIQFDERGDVQKFPRVYVVADGALLDFEAEVMRRREELLKRLRNLEQRQSDG
jgi:branched-chain amino acid transport system substrate-binding protein